jgi:two-component system sensor histidine kinase KdpD
MTYQQIARHLLRTIATSLVIVLVAGFLYVVHSKPLTAGLVDLVLVMLFAFRWGFFQAVVASGMAAACMDYFYMAPFFSLYEHDPQDWISSGIFVSVALTAGHFANHIKQKSIQTDSERTRLERLYLTSRDIIMLDRRGDVGTQLIKLIADTFCADAVALWDAREIRMYRTGEDAASDEEIRGISFHGRSDDNLALCRFKRVLRLGITTVGALYIAGSSEENRLNPRSVDAIASLSALALERAHSFMAESNAEAAKRTEQLRSTVLDGLAHAFKTPLATIQSASSGLLEINRLENEERELVALIDEEATRLAKLTNQVLQTAKLDEALLKVNHEEIDLCHFLEVYRQETDLAVADHPLRIIDETSNSLIWADARLLQMALIQMLDNASKYARPLSPITLRVATINSDVVFSVENEGSSIPAEDRLRVFERFYRSPGSQHKASGTGIGLSVTKRIADAHCGRVWVECPLKERTTFFFALPLAHKES